MTWRMVKFSNTLFIIYLSGRCFSFLEIKIFCYNNPNEHDDDDGHLIKLIMYSHIGLRCILYRYLPPSYLGYSVSTFSTTCFPKLQTLVEHWMVMFSVLS